MVRNEVSTAGLMPVDGVPADEGRNNDKYEKVQHASNHDDEAYTFFRCERHVI